MKIGQNYVGSRVNLFFFGIWSNFNLFGVNNTSGYTDVNFNALIVLSS